jgi:hypothetical protein
MGPTAEKWRNISKLCGGNPSAAQDLLPFEPTRRSTSQTRRGRQVVPKDAATSCLESLVIGKFQAEEVKTGIY